MVQTNAQEGFELWNKSDIAEIGGPVLYLASDLASFVTGSTHVVDGGEVVD